MITYAATFTTGFSKTVEERIKNTIDNCEVLIVYDGLIVFKTDQSLLNVKIPFLNNIYNVIGIAKVDSESDFNNCLQQFVKRIRLEPKIINKFIKKNSDFKIMNIDKNQPVSINFKIIEPLENEIKSKFNLKFNKKNPKTEFVVLRRRENVMLFMLKISYNRQTEKNLHKGELRPELANLMISQIYLNNSSIVMDPFCGHGAIPKEIIKNFNYNMCFASDNDDDLISKLKKQYKGNNKKLFIKNRDALNLDYFENNFIDAIITDPPWNIYNEQDINCVDFYKKMLIEFKRILKNNGKLVILMGNVVDFEKSLSQITGLTQINKFNTLVNGKKATLYVLEKNN